MYNSSDSTVPFQEFEKCPPDECCTTGTGPNTVHFKVPKSKIVYQTPQIVYGKIISCSAGKLMFETFRDEKCTVGDSNAALPWFIKADGSCQSTPSPPTMDDRRTNYHYGYGSYYSAKCNDNVAVPRASISVSGFFDSSCSLPNVDIMSPVNCDSTQCCLIAKRKGVNYLGRGVAQYFATAADCQNNVTAHPQNVTSSIVTIASNIGSDGFDTYLFKVPSLNFSGFPVFDPPFDRDACNDFTPNNCTLPLYSFTARFGSVFPRKQRLLLCRMVNERFAIGYFAVFSGNGKWSFDVRIFSKRSDTYGERVCQVQESQIFVDASVPSDKMCPTDTCCRVGNSSASFFVRFPSSMLTFDNSKNDMYARLLSCDGDVAMYYQYSDSACSIYSDWHPLFPQVLRADGSCSAVPSDAYAIDSFYRAKCSSPTVPLVQTVSVSAFSDSKCASANTNVQPQAISCPINQCCLVRKATALNSAVYGRALSCNSNVLFFNTYKEPNCIIPNFYAMALQSDDSCQVDRTGYTPFYRASCKLAPPPVSLACPKDPQGNICGGPTYGTCSQRELASGIVMAVCVCVPNVGFFDGKTCTSATALSAVIGAVNQSFLQQQQQADRLKSLSCADPLKPVKCPSDAWVDAQQVGQCCTSMAACATSAAAFRTYLQTQSSLCTGSTPSFDYVLLQCVASNQLPMPVFSCPAGMMRCSDGSCNSTCSNAQTPQCPSGSTGAFLCPGNQVFCAASLSECSQKQPWNGCPVNQVQCPNRPGVCVAVLQNCASAPGP
jgi:hypothetical protein